MIENKTEISKDLEKALQALEQAKQRVANEKKKQNEKKRKAENHHKYIMGGIIVKYFPECYRYDESELNRILSTALQASPPAMCAPCTPPNIPRPPPVPTILFWTKQRSRRPTASRCPTGRSRSGSVWRN